MKRPLVRGVALFLLPAAIAIGSRATASDAPGGAAGLVEKEFANAIKTVTPATVFCVPKGVPMGEGGGSSGVMITRSGYVLSDGDVGLAEIRNREKKFASLVEVRVPDPKRNTF